MITEKRGLNMLSILEQMKQMANQNQEFIQEWEKFLEESDDEEVEL
jgi:hypothetical protein